VNEPLLNGNESKYLLECIETGLISSEGPFITRFEREFAATVGRKHATSSHDGCGAGNDREGRHDDLSAFLQAKRHHASVESHRTVRN
ncbi:DegT/DnrJ/EryC1/StrS family aminotransferase, partial [Rhizobium leguminosarum]|uniref:DegT/DnrJ/EryC1/StrS family aminotransferase n=1 Tax=Rhizobium leguminosarum TaxID=384 RepID=UPI003F9D253D